MIKVLIVEDENGTYQDKDGKRFNLIYGSYVVGPRAKDFTEFESFEDMLDKTGLIEVK